MRRRVFFPHRCSILVFFFPCKCNQMPFYMRELSACVFWYPRWVLEANQEDPSDWMPLLAIAKYILLDRYTISLSLVWLICNPLDYSPPGSSVHGISQARILEWVAISFSIFFHYRTFILK